MLVHQGGFGYGTLWIDLAVLTAVVYAMAVKPTADQGAELAVGAGAVVAVLGLGARLLSAARGAASTGEGRDAALTG
ncbi:MAG: hypothetical protein M5U27_14620 [Gaiella sp.]|nr:hypothetical protein [Gaiella sp.]